MKSSFKEKAQIFKALFCLTILMVLWCVFSLALPQFLSSDAGRIFSLTWAVAAAIMVAAQVRRLLAARRRRYELPPEFRLEYHKGQRKNFGFQRKMTRGLLK